MIDKCANPECDERLVYLRSGVLYAVDMRRAPNRKRFTHFFWMCKACASRYKLHFNNLGEPDVVSMNMPTVPDNSERSNCSIHSILINPSSQAMPKAIVTAEPELMPAIPRAPKIDKHRKFRFLSHSEEQVCT